MPTQNRQRARIQSLLSVHSPDDAPNPLTVSGWGQNRPAPPAASLSSKSTTVPAWPTSKIVVDANCPDYALVDRLTTGCSLTAAGVLRESPGRGQRYEVAASGLHLLGEADPEEYPLQKKRHTLEFLRELAHLRPRTNTFGAVARVRNAMAFGIHQFFQQRGFLYVQTPIITASDAEGAGAMFRATTLDLNDLPTQDGPR